MARGVNIAMIIGNLGRDPEVRYTQNGDPVANFSVATSENWKDKASGEKRETTEWHSCVAFGSLAKVVGEYLRKGSQVFVSGKLQTSSWEQDGSKRYKTEIVVRDMQMLGERDAAPQSRPAPAPAPRPAAPAPADDDGLDDIPF